MTRYRFMAGRRYVTEPACSEADRFQRESGKPSKRCVHLVLLHTSRSWRPHDALQLRRAPLQVLRRDQKISVNGFDGIGEIGFAVSSLQKAIFCYFVARFADWLAGRSAAVTTSTSTALPAGASSNPSCSCKALVSSAGSLSPDVFSSQSN